MAQLGYLHRSGRTCTSDGKIIRGCTGTHKGCIDAAVKSGRLSPEAGVKAMENVDNRNMTIVTVGTGSARNGVVERIVGGERAVVHPERRP